MSLFTLQKRVVRFICGVKARDHTNTLFIKIKFIKFVDLIEYKTSILMYKVKHKPLPNSIERFFYSNEDSLHNTRKRDKFKKRLCCTELEGEMFFYLWF